MNHSVSQGGNAFPDVICLSHLRWNFVVQRPQHLMTRCARNRRVFFIEEPVHGPNVTPRLELQRADGVTVVVPHLAEGLSTDAMQASLRGLLDDLIRTKDISEYLL